MTMPDGNTAAERQHSADQALLEKRFEAHADPVVEGIVDDVMNGRAVGGRKMALRDFFDGEHVQVDHDEAAALLTGNLEKQKEVIEAIKDRAERAIREWCETSDSGQALVDDRIASAAAERPCRCGEFCTC